jgi:hypothetical protein
MKGANRGWFLRVDSGTLRQRHGTLRDLEEPGAAAPEREPAHGGRREDHEAAGTSCNGTRPPSEKAHLTMLRGARFHVYGMRTTKRIFYRQQAPAPKTGAAVSGTKLAELAGVDGYRGW